MNDDCTHCIAAFGSYCFSILFLAISVCLSFASLDWVKQDLCVQRLEKWLSLLFSPGKGNSS